MLAISFKKTYIYPKSDKVQIKNMLNYPKVFYVHIGNTQKNKNKKFKFSFFIFGFPESMLYDTGLQVIITKTKINLRFTLLYRNKYIF